MRNLLPILLLAAAPAIHAANLQPMSAVYEVLRDGKPVGEAKYTLAANADGSWTLRSETRGTSGLARLAGLDVREESTFLWRGDRAVGLRYDYRQDATFKHGAQTIEFDRAAHRAHVQDSKGRYDYAIADGAMDRASLYVVLGQAAASGVKDLTLPVAGRDHLEQQHFVAQGTERLHVPAGDFNAVAFDRVDMPGKGRVWYAAGTALPLRIEKVQGDGSTIVLELRAN